MDRRTAANPSVGVTCPFTGLCRGFEGLCARRENLGLRYRIAGLNLASRLWADCLAEHRASNLTGRRWGNLAPSCCLPC